MVSGTGRRVLATPHPSEIHHVSSVQALDRKGKALKHHKRARSSSSSPSPPPPRPIPSSQRVRPSHEEPVRRPAPAVASTSRPSQGAEDDQPSQNITDEEENKLVAEVMRHMLFKSHQQPNVPVRREELVQVITRTYKVRALSGMVISEAQERMRSTFGLAMRELVRSKSTKAGKPMTGMKRDFGNKWILCVKRDMKEYVLESLLPEELMREHVLTPSMATDLAFVLLVVSIVKFSGGQKVTEEALLDKLGGVGIKDGHPDFKDVKEAVATVVKQRYIQKEKLTGTEGEGFAYELAERALDPSFQRHFGDFVSQVVR